MNKLLRRYKKVIAVIITLAITVTSIDVSAFADVFSGPVIYNSESFGSIEEAVNKATEAGDKTPKIYLTENIDFDGSVTLLEDQYMTISSRGENKTVINFTDSTKNQSRFIVNDKAALRFENVEIIGNWTEKTDEPGKISLSTAVLIL